MSGLQAYHNSQEKYFRHPFGALPCGEQVSLRIIVYSDSPIQECFIRLWVKGEEILQPMQPASEEDISLRRGQAAPGVIFKTQVRLFQEPGLVWYYFKIKVEGQTYYYHNNKEELGGEGVLSLEEGPSFQITVYKPSVVPSWFTKGIMYQIYVDRFFNGSPCGKIMNSKQKSLIHAHWEDTPFYPKDEKGRITRWTFFGGNLRGVIQKLPYLQELGITIIYFNPIFEAASNHKYDTGDYLKIDPMYGDLPTFIQLIQEAQKIGISIILDGVFSHTGSDSRYFNKYGHYPEQGAFQAKESPYYSWYKLKEPEGEYESWWGVDDLPNVNELEPSYQNFIFGSKDSVVQFWVSKGVKGWRLDVVDELPDEFIKKLRQAVKETDSETVLIGEVWEDASRKVSYGKSREYFWGDELDSAMNYPLREILLNYFLGRSNAPEAYARIMSLYENYPRENFRAAMNIIGSHDRIRVLTLLGEAPAEESLTPRERENYRLSARASSKGCQRLKLLVLLQMTLPGVPCLYYGDEAGVEGFSDPYNRGTYPWGRENQQLREWYKKMIRLRQEYDIFLEGEFYPFYIGSEVLGFRSRGQEEEIIVCVNRDSIEVEVELIISEHKARMENLQKGSILALELLSGERIELDFADSENNPLAIKSKIKPLEGKVFYIGKKHTPISAFSKRSCGILFHLTSLPSRWGIGDMGKEAEKFVDFLASSGQRYWQILPLNPLGIGNSPYQSPSVMAGNILLISPERLQEEGLLTEKEMQEELIYLKQKDSEADKVNYPLAAEVKERLFQRAWETFQKELEPDEGQVKYLSREGYAAFLKQNKFWLEDYCLYVALQKENNHLSWVEWKKDIALREEKALELWREELAEEIGYQQFLQYTFFHQWQKLKNYANHKGIEIIGDLPIYAAADSCDTWAHRSLFKLDPEGNPAAVAGVPPDYFSKTGQHWGNPLYDWREMEKDSFAWWKVRIQHILGNYDYIRLDHFRGFESFWEIPAGEKTAVNGRWLKGPGKRFFETLREKFGELPFIAEDLGYLTPEVYNLKNILGFPGMKVYQFEASPDLKEEKIAKSVSQAERDTVYYSGTHDNDTLLGWYNQCEGFAQLSLQQKRTLAEKTIKKIYGSNAAWVIIPLQDILGLDSTARMNIPGTVQGNWVWRLKEDDLTENWESRLKKLATESGRISLLFSCQESGTP